eukprot:Plantae.Rhodophyta-Purpureofilum_apyrenoidigerum.ctg21674.p1 GENE.Plantae.Rhodophyta-Purpureofilum_apyrenoidigerum.ctg21674~~Plantae.Rhodophyta-Purpureofilum_apyrenoidigerum.ctg21674.p1  ORF type:complete len:479 (+),score=95.46 Plantae.Rhodophyta-Purpureofilum_apyrenoidigerum.ctg21674:216-1652(+)
MKDASCLSRTWSGEVRYHIGDEGALLLPKGQQILVSKAGRSRAVDDVALHREGYSESSLSLRMQGSDDAKGWSDKLSSSYGSLQAKTGLSIPRRRRPRKSNNILDAMIKSEQFAASSNRRYMLPHYDEDEDMKQQQTRVGPDPAAARVVEYRSGLLLFDEAVADFGAYVRTRTSNESTLWIHVEGSPQSALRFLGENFNMHPLAQEDVYNTPQRPKLDQYDDMLLVITHSPELLEENGEGYELALNQVSILVLRPWNILVTFNERNSSIKENWVQRVLERIRNNIEDVLGKDMSHLLYAVLDSVTDRYFPLLEFYGDRMEELEGALIDDPDPELIKGITRLKRDLLLIRRTVWPMRECTSRLMVQPDDLVKKATKMYLRDLQDHLVQVVDILETYRDVSMSLLDLYLSATNNKMQEVMKTLTIISTIFIPLTFITGVYGMNFEYMPELSWPFSYLVFWIIVVLIISSQLYYFHRLGWT